jgi:aspartate aminotransferase
VRVGWAFGPGKVIDKMKSILGHVGAWAPKAEQVASAKYLSQVENVDTYLNHFKGEVAFRLNSIYDGFQALKNKGYKVDIIAPQAAIYLSVQFDLVGKTTENREVLNDVKAVTSYLLNDAKLAIVPFYAFGTSNDSTWYRISIGTLSREDIPAMFQQLELSLAKLK